MNRPEGVDLLKRAKAGSGGAFNELYGRFGGRLLALIRLRLGRELRAHLESRDILQSTLLKAFQKIRQFEKSDTSSLMAWLARIAQNEIHDQADYFHRKRRADVRTWPLEDGMQAVEGTVRSAVSQAILTEEAARLERALEALDDRYREVILLRKFEDLSFKEIGACLGKSEDACRMLLARAMTVLTHKMEEAEGGATGARAEAGPAGAGAAAKAEAE